MNRLLVTLLCFITFTVHGQHIVQGIDFNTFVSPTNNDLVNNFVGSYVFTQIQTDGITGGSVSIPVQNGTSAIYKQKLQMTMDTTTVSISFKFDSLLYEKGTHNWPAVSFVFNAPTPAPADSIEFSIYGYVIWIRTTKHGGAGASLSPSQDKKLSHLHWYQMKAQIVMTPTGQVTTLIRLYDLDTSGLSTPYLVKERYGFFMNMFTPGDSATISINAQHAMGTLYLDNFSISNESPQSTRITEEQLDEKIVVPTMIQGNNFKISSSLGKQITYCLYSLDGKPIAKGSFINDVVVDCVDLANGMYMLRLSSESSSLSRKMVKY
jgi:hypothetical protein